MLLLSSFDKLRDLDRFRERGDHVRRIPEYFEARVEYHGNTVTFNNRPEETQRLEALLRPN